VSTVSLLDGFAPTDAVALQPTPLTAAAFVAAARRLADRMPDGSSCLLLCEDRLHFAVAFAAALLKGVTCLLPPSRASGAIEQVTTRYRPAFLLTDRWDPATTLAQVVVGIDPVDPLPAIPAIASSHVAAILFTSGTTGEPRAHAKTFGSLALGAALLRDRVGFAPRTPVIGMVPPQHMWGLEASVMLPLRSGGVIDPGMPLLRADLLDAIARYARAPWVVMTPLHVGNVAQGGGHLPGLAGGLVATSALDRGDAAAFERLAGSALIEIYGSTETGAIATRRAAIERDFVPLPGIALDAGDDGVTVRGAHVGDAARLPDLVERVGEGRFRWVGRDGDLVKIAGKRASLAGLTHELRTVPGVVDGEYVVVSQGRRAQRVGAVVVAPDVADESILRHLRERIDPVFLPRPLVRVAELPRNALGKASRSELARLLAAGAAGADAGQSSVERTVVVSVPWSHPALPGHFPDRPIVPAAWLLTLLDAAHRQAYGERCAVRAITHARFRRPALPGRPLRLTLTPDADAVRFVVDDGEHRVADGIARR
jgi:acyl-CoA synthetase (AMP-forming)/AMP-acid ligase II